MRVLCYNSCVKLNAINLLKGFYKVEDFNPSDQTVEQRMNELENRVESLTKLFEALTDSYSLTLDSVDKMREANDRLCQGVRELLSRIGPKVGQ